MRLKAVGIILVLISSFNLRGQSQLVLVNRDKVMARYLEGDEFTYKLKNSKQFVTSFITSIREFYVVTFNDTIQFAAIERVSLKGKRVKKKNLISKFLITAGIGYFVIDQINHVIVQGQPPDMEDSVWKPALIMVGTGYAIKLIYKRSQRLRYPARLLRVESDSPFYLSEQ